MNFGELKTFVLADTHCEHLTTHIATFVERAESFLASKLRSSEQDSSTVLDETDRVSGGVYTLPSGLLQVRRAVIEGCDPLEPVSIGYIRRRRSSSAVRQYAVLGNRIEFRGVPETDTEITLDYWGRLAALANDTDENALLTNHPNLYIHATAFYVYKHNQELELAQGEMDALMDAIDSVNEELGRKLGGAGAAPAYDFGCGGGY